jgi:hypothetical protein
VYLSESAATAEAPAGRLQPSEKIYLTANAIACDPSACSKMCADHRAEKDSAPKLTRLNSLVPPATTVVAKGMSKEEEEEAQQRRRDALVVEMLQHSCGNGEVCYSNYALVCTFLR